MNSGVWKVYSSINKTAVTGKTSSFELSKVLGDVEIGINVYSKRVSDKKSSDSYFDDDFSNLLTSFAVKDNKKHTMTHANNRFNSMPALIHIM